MKKLLGLLVILALVLGGLVPSVSGQVTPLVLFDDDSASDWTNAYSWVLWDDFINRNVGNNSLNATIPIYSQYEAIQLYVSPFPVNTTAYDYFNFWFTSNDTTPFVMRWSMATNSTNFYYQFFNVDNSSWEFTSWDLWSSWSLFGTPDPANITYLELQLSSNNTAPFTANFDYTFLSIGEPEPTPTPSPTPSPTPTPTGEPEPSEDNSVHIIYFGLLIAWLLISFILSLKYWRYFGPLGAMVGAVLALVIMNNTYFIVNQFYSETLDQVVNSYMAIGFLYWVPILLIIANVITPFLKK